MDVRYQHSATRMSDLIGAIYDCVLAPAKWTEVIDEIRIEFNFHNAVLAVNSFEGQLAVGAVAGIDDYWFARMLSYETAVIDLWGGAEKLSGYPLEEPIVQSRAVPFYDKEFNAYFTEWARPQGLIDAVVISLHNHMTGLANIALGRHESAGDISDVELEGLRLLAPHISRAVAISKVLELKTIEASMFSSTLETLNSAILIVDQDATCIHANEAGTSLLNARDPITLTDGKLTLKLAAATAALRETVHNAATGSVTSRLSGAGIPARRRDGTPMVLHVMPLDRRGLKVNMAQSAVAAIFVSPATTAFDMPTNALALLYGLTPAETRVFDMLVAGETQSEIATKLGLAVSTIKTHLLRVFEKTGCKRQVDLVRLAASLSGPA